MLKYTKPTNQNKNLLYNNILSLCRCNIFYTKFDLIDTFQNRIHLIFIHISFIFIKIKQYEKNKIYKIFYQDVFDLVFKKIELNMREIGFSDTTLNKNMRFLVKTFYSILLNCEKYKDMDLKSKTDFLHKFLKFVNNKSSSYSAIIDYFDKYQIFCLDLNPDSVLNGELNFKY